MAINISIDGTIYKDILSINYKGNICLLSEYEPAIEDRTILASNFEPNGAKFIYRYDNFDKDQDTIFIDTIIPDPTEKQNIFACVVDEQPDNFELALATWNHYSQLQLYAPYQQNKYLFEHCANTGACAKRVPLVSEDKHCTVAINKNGAVCNGELLYSNSGNADKSFMSLINKPEYTYFAIGSEEGSVRSYETYNEISIIHKMYNQEELKTLTLK